MITSTPHNTLLLTVLTVGSTLHAMAQNINDSKMARIKITAVIGCSEHSDNDVSSSALVHRSLKTYIISEAIGELRLLPVNPTLLINVPEGHGSRIGSSESNAPQKPPLEFSALPAEIRLKIWKTAITDFPRVVVIRVSSIDLIERQNGLEKLATFYSPTPPPAIALINKEVLHEFKSLRSGMYQKCFTPTVSWSRASIGLPGDIVFDPKHEIALLSSSRQSIHVPDETSRQTLLNDPTMNFLGMEDIRRIENVAISGWNLPHHSAPFITFCDMILRFTSLKKIYLLAEEEDEFYDLSTSEKLTLPLVITRFRNVEQSILLNFGPSSKSRREEFSRHIPLLTWKPEIFFLSRPGFTERQITRELIEEQVEREKLELERKRLDEKRKREKKWKKLQDSCDKVSDWLVKLL